MQYEHTDITATEQINKVCFILKQLSLVNIKGKPAVNELQWALLCIEQRKFLRQFSLHTAHLVRVLVENNCRYLCQEKNFTMVHMPQKVLECKTRLWQYFDWAPEAAVHHNSTLHTLHNTSQYNVQNTIRALQLCTVNTLFYFI